MNSEVMKRDMKQFMETFEDVMDFEFLDAPHITPDYQPYLDQGIKGPFRSWVSLVCWRKDPDTGEEIKEVADTTDGIEESLALIEEYIAANGPFDAFFTFSQGS